VVGKCKAALSLIGAASRAILIARSPVFRMIVVFCAFGAELRPLRTLLTDDTPLEGGELRGFHGRVGRSEVTVIASGIGTRRAQEAAVRAFERLDGVEGVITTGVAGALHADLPIGRVVLADRLMVRRGEEFAFEAEVETPPKYREPFAAALDAARIKFAVGPLLTSRRVIAKVADKRRAHETLGAIAVDMESAIIGLEATRRKLPFVCLRTIMDTAVDEIEGAFLADENGRLMLRAAAAALVRQPHRIIASIKLIRNLHTATRSMNLAVAVVLKRNA
jgi:adenosylhomocysteine nucleosidase